MLRAFGHRVATCWLLLAQVFNWSNLSKQRPTCLNMSQHLATRWPNARNMLHSTRLRYVVLACCDRLAGALRYLRALPTIRVHPELDERTLDIVHSLNVVIS